MQDTAAPHVIPWIPAVWAIAAISPTTARWPWSSIRSVTTTASRNCSPARTDPDPCGETHIHNDYVTGGLELACRHGATYVVPGDVELSYQATPVRDGGSFDVGDDRRRHPHPGHTRTTCPSRCARATISARCSPAVTALRQCRPSRSGRPGPGRQTSARPVAFGAPPGRHPRRPDPDLPHPRLRVVLRGHAGSGLSSTIGNEKTINPALTEAEEQFGQPAGRSGRLPGVLRAHGPGERRRTPRRGPVDARAGRPGRAARAHRPWRMGRRPRSRKVFAAGHVPGAVNFDLDGAFINYLAWMIPGAPR